MTTTQEIRMQDRDQLIQAALQSAQYWRRHDISKCHGPLVEAWEAEAMRLTSGESCEYNETTLLAAYAEVDRRMKLVAARPRRRQNTMVR